MDRIQLYRFLLLWPATLAFALPQGTATTTAAFPTMSAQDGTGVSEGGVGSTVDAGAAAGADGADKGAISMSKGAIVGMSIGIGIVIVSIATLWFFWYMAKKRQWDVRQSFRRASRRFTGRKVEPKTPTGAKANRRGTVYVKPAPSSKKRDLESMPEENKLPSMGWLADEKERSRSRSREPEEKKESSPATGGGWKSKLGLGKR